MSVTISSSSSWLVLWDFDNSLINENVDFFIPNKLWKNKEQTVKEFRETLTAEPHFTYRMNHIFQQLSEQGITEEEFENVIAQVPAFSEHIEVIQKLNELGIEQKVVSDANSYFITTWLRQKNLLHCFTEILTHPAEFQDGTLVNTMWTEIHPLKTENPYRQGDHMDKAEIVSDILEKYENIKVIYVGDGGGDFPGITVLDSESYTLVRKGYSLEKFIKKYPDATQCQLLYWENGVELKEHFQSLISEI